MNPKLKQWWNKICWEEKISHLKSQDLQQYLRSWLLVKNLVIKLVAFIIVGLIVMGSCFITRQVFIDYFPNSIVPNEGISFSAFAGANPNIIYLIQSIPCILTFLFFIFLNDKLVYISLLVVCFGGLSNIIDRALPLELVVQGGVVFPSNAVVDYIPFFGTTCNLPDIYISVGACFVVLFLIIYIVKTYKSENKNKPQNKQHE